MALPVPALAPVMVPALMVHEKVVPETGDEMPIAEICPEHIVLFTGTTTAVGAGFTKTVFVAAGPEQPSLVAIALYVTEPWLVPVAVNTCAMVEPVPEFVFPLAPIAVEVQANVLVPDREELKEILTGLAEQTVSFKTAKLTAGKGLTRTLVCRTLEEQPFKEETTVKVALWVAGVLLIYVWAFRFPTPFIAPTLLLATVQEIVAPFGAAP